MKKMEFCPDCGKILFMRLDEFRMVGTCHCGFFKEIEKGFLPPEKISCSEKGQGVFENSSNMEGFPHVCEKCGNKDADVFDLGASYSDESNVYLFKCKKCGHVSREADGSGNK